jgi:hypothetical protein
MPEEERAAHRAEMERYRALTGGALATEVMELIEDNLSRWYQGSWRQDNGPDGEQVCTAPVTAIEAFAEDPLNPSCTTSFCYAGFVGAIKGVRWAKGRQENIGDPKVCDCTTFCCEVDSHQISVATYAAEQLGIELGDADALFNGENNVEQLRSGTQAIVYGWSVVDAISGDDYDDDEEEDEEDDDD